jgi:serine/threonine-protein kinase
VFDNVGLRWLAVTISRGQCVDRDDEIFSVVSLQPQPDGTMSGESTQTTAARCFSKRTVTVTRTADTDISLLPNPATLAPRVVSPADALHGSYDGQITYANGYKPDVGHYHVRTDCLRTGDRCISDFTTLSTGKGQAFVYANGAWTRNAEFDEPCSLGGVYHAKYTHTLPLPQPPQDPIALLTGHGYVDAAPGTKCHSQAFDQTFTRTGD